MMPAGTEGQKILNTITLQNCDKNISMSNLI